MFTATKITKNRFIQLFKIFSFILLINYPLLPFLGYFLGEKKPWCEDDVLTCGSAILLFMFIIFLFWCIVWFMNYAVFFMDDYKHKKAKNKIVLPFYWYINYLQNAYRDRAVQSSSLKVILAVICCGDVYLLCYELFNLFTQ